MYVKKCLLERKKYCSRSCMGKNTPLAKGEVERNTKAWNKGKKLHYDVWNKGRPYKQISGRNNPNWKGGKTNLLDFIRTCLKYKEWRGKVYERDDYTCVHCGKRGGELNADHIYPISVIIDEEKVTKDNYRSISRLWDVGNGRTLCRRCHMQTDTFGVNFIRWEIAYTNTED